MGDWPDERVGVRRGVRGLVVLPAGAMTLLARGPYVLGLFCTGTLWYWPPGEAANRQDRTLLAITER